MAGHAELVEEPVVERAMIFEFQRAQRGMGNPLDGIRQTVREVVHRVDAPVVAGPVVRDAANAVDGRVPHIHVGRGHVDLGPEREWTHPRTPRPAYA